MSNKDFWNEKYNSADFLYTKNPNQFFQDSLIKYQSNFTSKIALMPGDGDGRNGLWLAKQGFQVEAFDYSEVAVEKAMNFARLNSLDYLSSVVDIQNFEIKKNKYDMIG